LNQEQGNFQIAREHTLIVLRTLTRKILLSSAGNALSIGCKKIKEECKSNFYFSLFLILFLSKRFLN
jgi:hypothetical protein